MENDVVKALRQQLEVTGFNLVGGGRFAGLILFVFVGKATGIPEKCLSGFFCEIAVKAGRQVERTIGCVQTRA